MAIDRMKRVEVVGHLDCKDDVLRALQKLGVLEIEDITEQLGTSEEHSEDTSDESPGGLEELVTRDSSSERLTAIEADITRIRSSLESLERFSPRKRSFIEQFAGYQIPLTQQEMDQFSSDAETALKAAAQLAELEQQHSTLVDRESGLLASVAQVRPWEGLDVPVEMLEPTRHTAVFCGTVTLDSEAVDDFTRALAEAARGAAVVRIASAEEQSVRLVAVAHKEYEDDVLSVLRSYDFSPQSFPCARGRVVDFLINAEAELRRVRTSIDKTVEDIKTLEPERTRLSARLDHLESERDRLLVTERLVRSEKAFGLAGWVRARDCAKLERTLSGIDDALVFAARDPEPGETHPIALVNSRLSRPFEVVLELYNMPWRGEIDPTAFVSFFFALFFAMAAADFGYGAVLAALCYVLLRTVRMSELGRKTFQLLFIAGVATMIVGLITGGFFGATLGFSLLNPVDDPIAFLLVSFAVGIVHLYAGMAIEFYENVRQGKALAGIFDQGLWMLLLASLVVLIAQFLSPSEIPYAQFAKYGAVVGAVGLVLTQGRHQKNPLLRLGSGLASLYNVFSYAGDVLSYCRLLGLGMASGVIAAVINLVAGMFWSTPVVGKVITIAILMGGHAFNLFIGVIGAYVHVSRLQYVEFFSKFFEGGGKAFSPFRIRSRYVYVKEAEHQGGSV